jgi:hypothetical protein
MNKPTIAEYNEAKQDVSLFNDWIWRCKEEQDELMDKISASRQTEKWYREALDKAKETVLIYETYEKLEAQDNDRT